MEEKKRTDGAECTTIASYGRLLLDDNNIKYLESSDIFRFTNIFRSTKYDRVLVGKNDIVLFEKGKTVAKVSSINSKNDIPIEIEEGKVVLFSEEEFSVEEFNVFFVKYQA